MKKEFKVGDRVCCYGQNDDGNFDCPTIEGDAGTVDAISETGFIRVKLDNHYSEDGVFCFHPKQLRRLVKKQRREFWLARNPHNGKLHVCELHPNIADEPPAEIIHVREVKRK